MPEITYRVNLQNRQRSVSKASAVIQGQPVILRDLGEPYRRINFSLLKNQSPKRISEPESIPEVSMENSLL